jgi:excisionase family DNA binding protein
MMQPEEAMSRRLSEILVHQDWEEKHGRIRYSYAQPMDIPFVAGSKSSLVPPPDKLLEAEEIAYPLFNSEGYCNIVAEIGRNGVYLLYLRPHHRLTKIVLTPDDVVVDLFLTEDERMMYSFFNPTSRSAITVVAQIVEDIEGVFRKISTAPDDLTWRQYFVRRSMAKYDMPEWASPDIALPEIMTARQVAHYLNFELKTIQNWTSQGAIPFKKVGGSPRYLKSEIDGTLKANTLGSRSASTKPKNPPKKKKT